VNLPHNGRRHVSSEKFPLLEDVSGTSSLVYSPTAVSLKSVWNRNYYEIASPSVKHLYHQPQTHHIDFAFIWHSCCMFGKSRFPFLARTAPPLSSLSSGITCHTHVKLFCRLEGLATSLFGAPHGVIFIVCVLIFHRFSSSFLYLHVIWNKGKKFWEELITNFPLI
jgi:hypothetical protein